MHARNSTSVGDRRKETRSPATAFARERAKSFEGVAVLRPARIVAAGDIEAKPVRDRLVRGPADQGERFDREREVLARVDA